MACQGYFFDLFVSPSAHRCLLQYSAGENEALCKLLKASVGVPWFVCQIESLEDLHELDKAAPLTLEQTGFKADGRLVATFFKGKFKQ
jgi:hypothetical protein